MFFDPLYYLLLVPALALTIWAEARVLLAGARGRRRASPGGVSGADAASKVLIGEQVPGVRVEAVSGEFSDHFDAKARVLRLSPWVFEGRSAAAVGVAAHEAGHAIRESEGFRLGLARGVLVPLSSLSSGVAWIVLVSGWGLGSVRLILLGMLSYSAAVGLQLAGLPIEVDASRRARRALEDAGLLDDSVDDVLKASAWARVAAILIAPLSLLSGLVRSGIIADPRPERPRAPRPIDAGPGDHLC